MVQLFVQDYKVIAELFFRKPVRLYGLLTFIIFDRDMKFADIFGDLYGQNPEHY